MASSNSTPLDTALLAAQNDSDKYGDNFVRAFLNTPLLIPVRDTGLKPGETASDLQIAEQEMLVIEHEIGPIVPAFDDIEKLRTWMKGEKEIHHTTVLGGSLTLVLNPDVSIALNPQHNPNYVFHKEDLARLREVIERQAGPGEAVAEPGDDSKD